MLHGTAGSSPSLDPTRRSSRRAGRRSREALETREGFDRQLLEAQGVDVGQVLAQHPHGALYAGLELEAEDLVDGQRPLGLDAHPAETDVAGAAPHRVAVRADQLDVEPAVEPSSVAKLRIH